MRGNTTKALRRGAYRIYHSDTKSAELLRKKVTFGSFFRKVKKHYKEARNG